MQVGDATVVITGASSGIGRATALAFADAGANLVLTARAKNPLRAAEKECADRGAQALSVPADVSSEAAVREVRDRAVDAFGRIDVWVNAAVVGAFGPFLVVPLADVRRIVDVNVMGYVYGSRAALEQMRRQGSGVLVNISSVTAFAPTPYNHAYVMSKAANRALSATLRQELRLDGARDVHVCTVLPAAIDTPFWRHAGNYSGRKIVPMPPVYPPELVADTIVNLVRAPRPEMIVGGAGRVLRVPATLTPGLVERLLAHYIDRTNFAREPAPEHDGNLFHPWPGTEAVDGGWHGRRLTAVRGAAAATAGALVATGAIARQLFAGRRAHKSRARARARSGFARVGTG
ncbi:SDR family NAD(P)-dependent oxidoreductase [Planosporangium flavigriseum]|uniref:Short-chain dehydrogenase n=1 Tax=Planosporangium flavigriseum TaxID=373681 RepID=A0A8J3LM03_9ACTN|nr:SDR family oxidoreductase [Planosporangium flavigriseum]NJC65917.1 SDR family NAD(P)-dependent oxidoreductase [Planosporangium flavigriseum]GIG75623.1 short-chain dehydrogenase [Planosporangium flavigriseum]